MTRTQRIDNIKQPTHETSQADKGSLDGKSKQLPLQKLLCQKSQRANSRHVSFNPGRKTSENLAAEEYVALSRPDE
jgi:hypothetical protein